jgi:hypothetical protein
MGIARVRSDAVWRQLRIVFIGSALLFLINIYFGFANALTVGAIPRSQILVHLHAGSVGWITLSAIGLGIWVVTGQRDVSASYERLVRRLTWAAVIVFAGYIPNFWLAFLPGESAVTFLLPIFGMAAVVVVWSAAVLVLSQLRHQPTLTTVQLLAGGALLVAAIGATVGALLGLERVIGQFLPLPQVDRAGAHAGMMDTYLFLVAAAGIEWITRPDAAQRWSWPGLVQAGAWTVGATLVPIAFFLNLFEALLPLFGLLLLLGMALFLVRVAWRALLIGPLAEGVRRWAFFATVWLVVFMGLFLAAVGAGDFASLPTWFGTAFVHAGFVGMMTNLILGVHSVRAHTTRDVLAWAEPAAAWVLNLGLLAFIGLKVAADVRTGAFVMGTGVLLGVGTMIVRLWVSGSRDVVPRQEPATAAGS